MITPTADMPELLAPVRDEVGLTAALAAGADAVYVGLGRFNMRVNSPGVAADDLGRWVARTHDHGARLYVTVNALIYDNELDALEGLLDAVVAAQADAVIAWDPAVLRRARARRLRVHLSTQAGVANADAARFYVDQGVSRIVLARELSLEQVAHIKRQVPVEIETFVHGAMCVAVSGRCLISQFLTGRSGNRGDCVQPCRRAYTVTDVETGDPLRIDRATVLSPRDLCTLGILDRLVAAGIDACKIEGRSRAPEYARTVVAAYRVALNAIAAGTYGPDLAAELTERVRDVYNRDFSTGFYLGRPGIEAWSPTDGNQARRRKVYVGKVLNYYARPRVAYVDVVAEPLARGDTIQVHGPTTGVVEMAVRELRTDEHGPIDRLERGAATLPVTARVRRQDQVFKIVPA